MNSLTPSFKCFYDAVNLIQHYAYSSFGKLIHIKDVNDVDITNSPLVATSYGFTNREFDSESQMMFYRARYYMPEIGRFIQEDKDPGQIGNPSVVNNRYTYVANKPTSLIDPTGNFVFTAILVYTLYAGGSSLAYAGAVAALGFLASVEISNSLSDEGISGVGDFYRGYTGEELLLGSATAFVFGGIGFAAGGKLGGWLAKNGEFGKWATAASKGFWAGSFGGGFSTGALVYSGQVEGTGEDVGRAFIFGGIAGATTGSINYLFRTNIHPPLVLASEGGLFFYQNFGLVPHKEPVDESQD